MIDLAKLLIADGQPSQELIDHQIDNTVKKMVDAYLYESDETMLVQDSLLNVNSNLKISDDNLFIYSYSQHFDEVIQKVERSIERYSPFLKLDPDHEHPAEKKRKKVVPNKLTGMRFYLVLEITPTIKKAFLLSQQLPEKEEEKSNRRLKI
jgi:hypothetical protein